MIARTLTLALVLCSGCAGASAVSKISDTALPRVGAGLQSAEALYLAACNPEPLPGLDKVCPAAKDGINAAVDGYTEVNNAVKEAQ